MNTEGDVTGAEALIRWKQDDQLVLPGEFIDSAESTGQIVAIGQWVLSTACAQLADWACRPETAGLSLSVNISARQFVEPDFVQMAEAIFTSTGADLAHLKLELTENLLVSDVTNTASKMEHLKGLGVTFSLDDFGTGYSSLAYLRNLPLDELKIDYAFVKDVLVNRNDASIVRSIITLANEPRARRDCGRRRNRGPARSFSSAPAATPTRDSCTKRRCRTTASCSSSRPATNPSKPPGSVPTFGHGHISPRGQMPVWFASPFDR